jgi:predicted nucleic acid-binding Zn ribbon protein
MVTRNLRCPECDVEEERIAIGMAEPNATCKECGNEMAVVPSFPGAKPVFIGAGFHCNDYPKSYDQLVKDYGLEKHDSTNPDSEYNRNPDYADEMAGGG